MSAYVYCFSHLWRSSTTRRVITLFTVGSAVYFSCLIIRMNRSHTKGKKISFSFAPFFSLTMMRTDTLFHLSFSYLYEKEILDFLLSRDYLLVIITCLCDCYCPCHLTGCLISDASRLGSDTLS